MTMQILINTNKNNFKRYFVHTYHETDMVKFLKNHPDKGMVTINTKNNEGVEWYTITLTPEDIQKIKETTWYKNTKWDYPDLDEELTIGTTIEVLDVKYVPEKEEQ